MGRYETYKSDFLVVTPSAFHGVGTVMNVAGNYYRFNSSENESEADYRAIGNDWKIVGQDLRVILDKLEKELAIDSR